MTEQYDPDNRRKVVDMLTTASQPYDVEPEAKPKKANIATGPFDASMIEAPERVENAPNTPERTSESRETAPRKGRKKSTTNDNGG